MKKLISLFFILSAFSFDLSSQNSLRLPNNTKPEAYNVFLSFDNDKLDFIGEVNIKIKFLEDSENITLHSGVNVNSITLTNAENVQIEVDYNYDNSFIVIKLQNENLKKDSYVNLKINYTGEIRSDGQGLYKESYLDENSTKRYFLATHLQPTFARYVFPCYDEPSFKATFTLTVRHSNNYHAISNMDLASPSILLPNNQLINTFKTTPPMSTYLFALFISDFESIKKFQNERIFRGFAREGQENRTDFSVNNAIKVLRQFEEDFDVSYGNEKLDQVAIPNFKMPGMENNFVIFYNDEFLLHEDGVTTNISKEISVQIVTHEVCHQFFGNQQTYQWWNYVWLAEGFCRYFEYHMTDKFFPEMRKKEKFALDNLHIAFDKDLPPTNRAMNHYVESPSEIISMFDMFTYTKGASVIKMLIHAFTEEKFNKALKTYLKTESGVVTSKDLYNALQEEIPDLNVTKIFSSWELQTGFPTLYVQRSYNDYRVRFSQQIFSYDYENLDTLWSIPITYLTPNSTVSNFWLPQSSNIEISMRDLNSKEFLLVNVDQTGYYRVMYDDANWMLLANELNNENFNEISPSSRAMLIDDAWAFAKKGNLKMTLFFELIKYLEHEIDLIPWLVAEKHLDKIWFLLHETEIFENFNEFFQILIEKSFYYYKIEEESLLQHHQVQMQNIAINLACKIKLPDCLKQTEEKFEKLMKDEDFSVSVNLKGTILCNGVINGNEIEFNYLWNLFKKSNNSAEKKEILFAIGCIENVEILKQFIKRYKEVEIIWALDMFDGLYNRGPITLKVLKNFLKEEEEEFKEFITNGNYQNTLNQIFSEIAYRTATQEGYYDLENLLNIYDIRGEERSSILIIVNSNINWITNNVPNIEYFLRNYLNSGNKLGLSWIILMVGWMLRYFVNLV